MNLVKIYYTDYTPHFLCEVKNDIETNGEVKVSGTSIPNTRLLYWAVAPTTRGYSFSGSGLPYPSYHVGLEEVQILEV